MNKRLGGYVKLAVEDRRAAVAELVGEGESNRGIAAVLGVDEGTIRNDLCAENSALHTDMQQEDHETGAENSAPVDAVAALSVSEKKGHNHRAQGTGENEWYTPSEYIEAARKALGEIDLDPATSEIAQRAIRAKHFYTKETDGLTKKWKGRVWLNPPYSQPAVQRATEKIAPIPDRRRCT